MRIALLMNNSFPPREGIGRHVHEVATRLIARGHGVTVLTRGRPFGGWATGCIDGIDVAYYPFFPVRPFHVAASRPGLQGWLRRQAGRFDILHAHLPLVPALSTALPIVTTIHSALLTDAAAINEPGLMPGLIRTNIRLVSSRTETWYLRRSNAVICVSEGVRAEIAAHYEQPANDDLVIPNAVDLDYFAPPIKGARRDLLYVGRLGYRKGLLRLLEAFAQLTESRPDLRLVLVGDGPLESLLRRRCAALGITDKVEFSGFLGRGAVRSQLQKAAVVVNPADYESGPLTILEAMACGTPVVSTRTGLMAEIGVDGRNVLLCKRCPNDLARAIAACLDDPDASARRAVAGRHLLERDYGWDSIVDRLEALYQRHAA